MNHAEKQRDLFHQNGAFYYRKIYIPFHRKTDKIYDRKTPTHDMLVRFSHGQNGGLVQMWK